MTEVKIVKAQKKPPVLPGLAPQEQAFLYLLRVKEDLLNAVDALRPKILFRRSLSEYRQMLTELRGEVYIEDILRGIGGRGKIRITY